MICFGSLVTICKHDNHFIAVLSGPLINRIFYRLMAGIDDLEAAFRFLRPLCVLVTQNHDKGSVCSLKEVLNSRALNVDFLQELQEYVAFPLRLVLKQFALK